MNSKFEKDLLTEKVIGCCFKVHRELGPGFIEKIYSNALQIVLQKAQLNFIVEKEFIVMFEQRQVGKFRCDLLIENFRNSGIKISNRHYA